VPRAAAEALGQLTINTAHPVNFCARKVWANSDKGHVAICSPSLVTSAAMVTRLAAGHPARPSVVAI